MKKIILSLASLALIHSALGSITVHFVEEGTDVRVSFSGTINLADYPGTDSTVSSWSTQTLLAGDSIYVGGNGYFSMGLGDTTTSQINMTSGLLGSEAFGFHLDFLVWSDRHLSGESVVGNVVALSADPAIDTFVLTNSSLNSLNAEAGDIAEGATLWTSYGNPADTFIFSRIAPVPEPSTGLLGILSALGLLRRRR